MRKLHFKLTLFSSVGGGASVVCSNLFVYASSVFFSFVTYNSISDALAITLTDKFKKMLCCYKWCSRCNTASSTAIQPIEWLLFTLERRGLIHNTDITWMSPLTFIGRHYFRQAGRKHSFEYLFFQVISEISPVLYIMTCRKGWHFMLLKESYLWYIRTSKVWE
jgi:hypothetical protein